MKVSSIIFSILISSSFCFSQSIDSIKERIAYTDSINKSKDRVLIQLMKNSQNQIINYDQAKFSSDDIVSLYYIWMGQNNKVLAFSIQPYSESGDWFKQHLYYLNDRERVINYSNTLRFFNGICTDGALESYQSIYYDSDSNILSQISTLTDREGNDMTDQGCIMNYKNPLKLRKDLTEILSEEGIKKSW
jgi:hypothetical protein